jgi:hypothetical protein
MHRLPPEVIDRVTSMLGRNDLKHVLLLSPAFQAAAECHSGAFANFTFTNGRHDAQRFVSMYSGRRLRYLHNIEIQTRFQSFEDTGLENPSCREPQSELDAKTELFTKKIRSVFEHIKKVEYQAKNVGHGPGKIHLTIITPQRMISSDFCRHRLSSAWRVKLLRPNDLPTLESIRGLSICNVDTPSETGESRVAQSRIEPRVAIDLACKLPNLEYLGCRLGVEEWEFTNADPVRKHFEHDYGGCARDARAAFAEALAAAQLPPALREVQLDFFFDLGEHLHLDQDEGGPELVAAGHQDLFSKNLCVLTRSLKRLDLKVKADITLFWPVQGETAFPSLELLSVMFFPITPSGAWYFRGPSGRGAETTGHQITDDMYPPLTDDNAEDAQWHYEEMPQAMRAPEDFRRFPNEHTMHPFLEAFAKAAQTMQSLKAFSLWSPLARGLAWGIAYAKPGEPATIYSPERDFCNSRQLWWKVGDWRPDSELHQLFQNIGRLQHGEEVLEYWNEGEAPGQNHLPDQETFVESLAAMPSIRLERAF